VTCGMSAESAPWPNIFWIVPGRRWFKPPGQEAIAKIIEQFRRAGCGSLRFGRAFAASAARVCWLSYLRRIMRGSKFQAGRDDRLGL